MGWVGGAATALLGFPPGVSTGLANFPCHVAAVCSNALVDFLDDEDVKHVFVFNDPKSGELVASQHAPNT